MTPATIALIRENERMRSALRAIRRYAENSSYGAWRSQVAAFVDEGLQQ